MVVLGRVVGTGVVGGTGWLVVVVGRVVEVVELLVELVVLLELLLELVVVVASQPWTTSSVTELEIRGVESLG